MIWTDFQAFSAELAALRTGSGDPAGLRSAQAEVVIDFALAAGADPQAEVGLDVLLSEDGEDAQRIRLLLGESMVVVADKAGPLLPALAPPCALHVHVIVDHSILTVIVNNRTALTTYVAPRDADSDRLQVRPRV